MSQESRDAYILHVSLFLVPWFPFSRYLSSLSWVAISTCAPLYHHNGRSCVWCNYLQSVWNLRTLVLLYFLLNSGTSGMVWHPLWIIKRHDQFGYSLQETAFRQGFYLISHPIYYAIQHECRILQWFQNHTFWGSQLLFCFLNLPFISLEIGWRTWGQCMVHCQKKPMWGGVIRTTEVLCPKSSSQTQSRSLFRRISKIKLCLYSWHRLATRETKAVLMKNVGPKPDWNGSR